METICSKCGKLALTSRCTRGGLDIGRYCADCFDTVGHDKPLRNSTVVGARGSNNDHSVDNAVRAWEESQ